MKRIAAFVCLLTLACGSIASAAPMPWTKFNDPAMLQVNVFASPGLCNGKDEIFVAGFKTSDAIYIMVYEPVSGRIAFTYAGLDGDPKEIGIGRVDPTKNNEIPPLRWQTFHESAHNDVCTVLFPTRA